MQGLLRFWEWTRRAKAAEGRRTPGRCREGLGSCAWKAKDGVAGNDFPTLRARLLLGRERIFFPLMERWKNIGIKQGLADVVETLL